MEKSVENSIFRFAMLNIIRDSLDRAETNKIEFDPASYSNNEDRVRFTCDGHKCVLLSIEKPNFDDGTCIMEVEAKGKELKEWEVVRLNFDLTHFRCNTLERIAYEVYDWVKDSDWEEWADYEKGMIADFFDTYDRF